MGTGLAGGHQTAGELHMQIDMGLTGHQQHHCKEGAACWHHLRLYARCVRPHLASLPHVQLLGLSHIRGQHMERVLRPAPAPRSVQGSGLCHAAVDVPGQSMPVLYLLWRALGF